MEHFGSGDHADVFAALTRGGTDWAARYRGSSAYRRYGLSPAGPVAVGPPSRYAPPPPRQGAPAQAAVMVARYLAVIAADRPYVAFLAALPLLLSLLARIVPLPYGLGPVTGADPRHHVNHQAVQLLLVLVVGGALMGTATAVRELIEEREVYRRERSVGLSPVAYLASKAVVLTGVVVVQSVVFVIAALAGRALPDRGLLAASAWPELVAAVALTAVASMAVGLALSAAVATADQVMQLLVAVVMVQIVFSGALFPVHGRALLRESS